MNRKTSHAVIPAKAGIHRRASVRHKGQTAIQTEPLFALYARYRSRWIPAFAGMTATVARGFLLFSFLLLAACGFHPVYGARDASSNSPVALDLNNIAIDNIPDRNGQMLRNDLIDRLYGKNRPLRPAFTLKVKLRNSEEDLGILANATATRSLLNMYGDYTLEDAKGKQLLSGSAHSVASFDRLDEMYGTVAARQDAYERTLHEVSEQIVNRLSLYFSEQNSG
ncbi:MAG: LPS assembly lipoprotein LptE [Alphaproteobacteria bacterium]|nr:LPS assembly lipoprotein LptE [Alphaproteobacteria bacterium]